MTRYRHTPKKVKTIDNQDNINRLGVAKEVRLYRLLCTVLNKKIDILNIFDEVLSGSLHETIPSQPKYMDGGNSMSNNSVVHSGWFGKAYKKVSPIIKRISSFLSKISTWLHLGKAKTAPETYRYRLDSCPRYVVPTMTRILARLTDGSQQHNVASPVQVTESSVTEHVIRQTSALATDSASQFQRNASFEAKPYGPLATGIDAGDRDNKPSTANNELTAREMSVSVGYP